MDWTRLLSVQDHWIFPMRADGVESDEAVPVPAEPSAAPPPVSGRLAQPGQPPRPSQHRGSLLYAGPSPHSGHHLDAFIRCPQYWAYRYGYGLLTSSGSLDPYGRLNARGKGSMGHIGLAHFFRRAQAEQEGTDPEEFLPWPEAVAVYAWEQDAKEEAGCTAWSDFVPVAIQTVSAFLDHRFCIRQMRLRVLSVEGVIDFHPIFGFPHTRSVDLVVQHDDGRVYYWDHKFTALPITARVRQRYAIDGQFLDYQIHGPRAWGDRWGGAWANLIRWPNKDQVDLDLNRVPPAPAAVAARPVAVQRAFQERAFLQAAGTGPWDWPKRLSELICVTPYGLCAGYELCAHGVEASPRHARLTVLD